MRLDRIGWYARRIGRMSPAEIAWRGSRAADSVVGRVRPARRPSDHELLGYEAIDWAAELAGFRASGAPGVLDRETARRLAADRPEQAAALVAAADAAAEGRFTFFGYAQATLGVPIDWHRDPFDGTRWPMIPAGRIDHRVFSADAKWIWELNRLQHLPVLAQAWLQTGEDRYAEAALDQLGSWIEANPPGVGIAWRGAFEVGVRAVSVTVALGGLRDSAALTPERYRAAVRMLAVGARASWRERSRFSSANNHLVGEMAGLAAVTLTLPRLAGADRLRQRAVSTLATEAGRQILADGAGAEQAIAYQVFTAELLMVVALMLRRAARPVPSAVEAALVRSGRYLAALVGTDDPVPRYGDDDEGFALRLDAAPLREVRSHLAAVAAFTGDATIAAAGRPDLAAEWFGTPPRPKPTEPAGVVAPDGGLVVLRNKGRRVTVDVGPLGYLAIAAHGHADALAVTLDLGGRELVGDPGAASYYGHPAWRAAHRGTRAHATVAVDGLDQSIMGGPFLWTRHATSRLRAVDLERGVVDAEHDGYTRLDDPVVHRRWVYAPPDDDVVLVVDLLTGTAAHTVTTSWPLAPELDAERVGDVHVVRHEGVPVLRISHAATAALTPTEVRGDETTELGWWSRRLESREPAWLLGCRVEAPLPVVLATVFERPVGGGVRVTDPVVTRRDGGFEIGWHDGARRRSVYVDPAADGVVNEPKE